MIRCLNCFNIYDEDLGVCPICGTLTEVKAALPYHLAPGTVIGERYIIGVSIGTTDQCIIYKAFDIDSERIIAVKEFYPDKIATRTEGTEDVIINDGSEGKFEDLKYRFLVEARTMSIFGSHRNLVNTYECFEENNTAYIAMELLEGETLSDYLKENTEQISSDFVIFVANEVGNALIALHKEGIIHRNVTPDNIFICNSNEITIKLLNPAPNDGNDTLLNNGYSSTEQYLNKNKPDISTDVYSLGATLYTMLTGAKPEESVQRKTLDTVRFPYEIDPSIPENLSNAVMKAMAVDKFFRFKSVLDFLAAINGEKKIIPLKKEKTLFLSILIASIASVVALIVIVVCLIIGNLDNTPVETYESSTATEESPVTSSVASDPTPTPTPTPSPTPIPTPTPDPLIDVYAAYRDVLTDYESKMRNVENASFDPEKSCALTDLTGDGIPELLILYESADENGITANGNDDFLVADIRIYTVTPGEKSVTEMLHISWACGPQAQGGHFYSYVVFLSNGSLLVAHADGDEGGFVNYVEYSLDGYTFQQENYVYYEYYLDYDNYDLIYEYMINGDNVSAADYNTFINNYMSMFTCVLAKDSYDDFVSSDWTTAINNTQICSLSFDEAWEILNSTQDAESNSTEETQETETTATEPPQIETTVEPTEPETETEPSAIDNSYYVDALSGWWHKTGGLPDSAAYYYKFTETDMEVYFLDESGELIFQSAYPVTYEMSSEGEIIVIKGSGYYYYLLNEDGDLECRWEDNGYSGTDSLWREE